MSIHKYVILSIAKDLLAVKEFCVRLHFCNPQRSMNGGWYGRVSLVSLGYIYVIRKGCGGCSTQGNNPLYSWVTFL